MRKKVSVPLGIILIVIVVIAGLVIYGWNAMQPTAASSEPVAYTLSEGTSTAKLASDLEGKGIIRNDLAFRMYLRWNDEGKAFKAGDYEFTPGMTYEQIITKLNNADVVVPKTMKFTIPEGYTVTQIADKLSSLGYVNRDEFMKLVDDPSQFKQAREWNVPTGNGILHPLEGYLFPATYDLPLDSTPADIIANMLAGTRANLATINNFDQKLKARNMTLHQLLTEASLIEREVVVPAERAEVAGVIDNRIKQGMRLQIDATVQYALGKQKQRLLYSDLKIDSPYNTYLHNGLPPGPIANPGIEAIKAALEPKTSDYLYYVTKKDGSGGHLFAKTYAEHQHNIALSKQTSTADEQGQDNKASGEATSEVSGEATGETSDVTTESTSTGSE
ncbi:endolytic transglycosylase MltG [Paenibacillus campi]|uniref:endolytic transglycosylase MltG n=1 Tax=Paenibacillus campi TaxID=3106031 RepID=UPI002AFF9B50|nr:endolytic transglycosylase MltG [Paenibacillus sp. SGZ-1009]